LSKYTDDRCDTSAQQISDDKQLSANQSGNENFLDSISSNSSSAHISTSNSKITTPSKKHNENENPFGGAQMSTELREWSKIQLNELTGSSELTLAHYLMTLKSPLQIEEHAHSVLGNSPRVNEFIAEFIRHKEFDLSSHGKVVVRRPSSHVDKKDALALGQNDKKKSRRKKVKQNLI